MDLNTVTEIARPRQRAELPAWRAGDAWLAGGTWLFSEPQPTVHRLLDLTGLGWPSVLGLDFVLTEQHLVDENGVTRAVKTPRKIAAPRLPRSPRCGYSAG